MMKNRKGMKEMMKNIKIDDKGTKVMMKNVKETKWVIRDAKMMIKINQIYIIN